MTAPLGFASTNTNASFVYNNMAVTNGGAMMGNGNTNAVVLQPMVQALDFQSATFMSARQPGGVAFRAKSNVAFTAPSNANAAIVMLDGMVTTTSQLGYTKNGAFIVALSGTTNSVVPLTNTQTNTNSFAGDTAFNTWNQITLYNLSGLDGFNSSSIFAGSAGTNGLSLGVGTNSTVNTALFPGVTIAGGSRVVIENVNGGTVNAANANLIFTPAANSTIGVVISGS